ncbi:MAG: NAD-dependent epimerase/dehydratase family protein [Anaerorhabdus sp.]
MKIIFLGCGYLGYNLSETLKKKHDVFVLGLENEYSKRSLIFKNCDVFSDDIFKYKDLLKDAIVIDTLSLISSTLNDQDDQKILDNIKHKYDGLYSNLKECEIKSYYFFSSGGTIYGDCTEKADETTDVRPVNLYAKSKLIIEELIKESYLEYLILRISNPYGGYQLTDKKQGVIPILIYKAIKNENFELWNDIDSTRDYLYISDLCKYIELLIESDVKNEIINVASSKGVSMKEIFDILDNQSLKLNIIFKQSPTSIVHTIVLNTDKLKAITKYEPMVSIEDGIISEIKRIKEELK